MSQPGLAVILYAGWPFLRLYVVSVIQRAILRVFHEQKQGINTQFTRYRSILENRAIPVRFMASL